MLLLVLAPCAYEPEKLNLDPSPSYSFGTKNIHERPNNNPAPGAYEPEKTNLSYKPSFSFGHRVNHERPSDTPGKHS